MYRSGSSVQRTASALASAGVVGAALAMLVFGLQVRLPPAALASLTAFSLAAPPSPRPEPPPPPKPADAPAGASSPANLRNRATPIVAAPAPDLRPPPPITAATAPAQGDASQTGASDRAGPGQGAGGSGQGTGGGGSGLGLATGPQQIRGRLSVNDFPLGLIGPGERASVGVRYAVEPDGTVGTCQVQRSSGFAEVDAMACRLIAARFRFRPARDRLGQPVRSTVTETHTWFRRLAD